MAAPMIAKFRSIFPSFSRIYIDINRWQRFNYIRFMRQVMAECTDATIDDISILYRSEKYVVVNKRYDVLINSEEETHTNPMFGNIDVAKQLFHVMPEVADPKLEHHFRFVHRLDFATSGVLCLGLKRKAAGKAAIKFQQRLVTKHYLALVRNTVYRLDERSELTISAAIGRDKTEDARHIMTTADNPNCESPRPCKTKMVLLETGKYDGEPASKVLLIPETGRTHQLRVHCRHVGHQIVGDYAYSNRTDVKPYRMMLHAFRLVIPLQNEHIDVVAPDPFTPETDKLWQPDKVVRTYDDYVKDQDFKKTLSSGKKISPGRKPKQRNIRDGTKSSAPCTTGDFDGATNTAVSVTGDSNRSSNSGPSAGHGASQTPIVKM